jgi:hypothetical protein
MDRERLETGEGDPKLGETAEQLLGDLDMLRDAVAQRAEEVRDQVTGFVNEHPYAAMGAAFGIGYLLSGALVSRTTGRLLGFGTRFLVGTLVKQMIAGGALDAVASSVGTGSAHAHRA